MGSTALIVWSFWKEKAGVATPGILYLASSNLRKIFQYKYVIGTRKTLWYKSLELVNTKGNNPEATTLLHLFRGSFLTRGATYHPEKEVAFPVYCLTLFSFY